MASVDSGYPCTVIRNLGSRLMADVRNGRTGESVGRERSRADSTPSLLLLFSRSLADLAAYFRAAAGSGKAAVKDVVTLKAVESADALNVRCILTRTQSTVAPCLISRFKPDCWILSHGGDEKTNNLLALSYGVHPVCLDVETNGHIAIDMRLLVEAGGMVEKDERVILVEDESTGNLQESFLIKIMRA